MMKRNFYLISLLAVVFICVNLQAQTATSLDVASFAAKMKQLPNVQLIDVRTPGEFAQGHIANAKNVDINSSDFQQKASKFDKNKAVLLYCLSGGRSSNAMNVLSSMGFKEIYNLSGGMMRWRAANMPETTDNASPKPAYAEMTMAQYQSILNSNRLVLVDFYADWCLPCKKMKPYLEEISKDMNAKVVVIRIDADANKTLAKELKVDALPVLMLYKAKKIVWSNKGYISKEELVKKIKSN